MGALPRARTCLRVTRITGERGVRDPTGRGTRLPFWFIGLLDVFLVVCTSHVYVAVFVQACERLVPRGGCCARITRFSLYALLLPISSTFPPVVSCKHGVFFNM